MFSQDTESHKLATAGNPPHTHTQIIFIDLRQQTKTWIWTSCREGHTRTCQAVNGENPEVTSFDRHARKQIVDHFWACTNSHLPHLVYGDATVWKEFKAAHERSYWIFLNASWMERFSKVDKDQILFYLTIINVMRNGIQQTHLKNKIKIKKPFKCRDEFTKLLDYIQPYVYY